LVCSDKDSILRVKNEKETDIREKYGKKKAAHFLNGFFFTE